MKSLFERMAEAQRISIPPVTNEDRLPHEKAVWRDYDTAEAPVQYDGAPAPGSGGKQVSIDFGDGQVVEGWGHLSRWQGARRWRFGWAPRA